MFVAAGVIGLAIIANLGPNTPEAPSSMTSAEVEAQQLERQADQMEAAAKAAENRGPWSYSSTEDSVRGARSFQASTTSTNQIQQASPYGGGTSMEMTVRKHPEWGTDVILTITEGQMMCPSYSGCDGLVRFDDAKPQHVRFTGPADNSSEVIFVSDAKAFVSKLKRAEKVVIEKTLYQAGAPQFSFNVTGLKDFDEVFDAKGNMLAADRVSSDVKCDPKLAASVGLGCDK